jgi:Ser/Thr protein kinase RdoA (MazF antagonist)
VPGPEELGEHLSAHYGIAVRGVEVLDRGVYQLQRSDGPDWVARVWGAGRSVERVRHEARLLSSLADAGWSAEGCGAERCAVADPVSELDGGPVLVTLYEPPVAASRRAEVIRAAGGLRALGGLLGHLATGPGTGPFLGTGGDGDGLPGGGWHHLVDGTPGGELEAAEALVAAGLEAAEGPDRDALAELTSILDGLDGGDGLPEGPVHPDPVLANVVATADGRMVLVDWTGAGTGPRAWPLAWLLFTEGMRDLRRIDRVVDGYRRHVSPEPEELARLAAMAPARAVVLRVWEWSVGRATAKAAVASARRSVDLAGAVAARAADTFGV